MGFLSWQRFRCNIDCINYPDDCISENLYMQMADRMADDGWKELGYDWINIDDCWADLNGRDTTTGRLQGDPTRFPSGMKALGDYIHSKGLKYGLYSDVGAQTCAGYPSSLGHYALDAQTFADWGVDSLKLDGCNLPPDTFQDWFPVMERALNATGRPMAYICVYGPYTQGHFNHTLASETCNQWRNYNDIQDDWGSVNGIVDWMVANQDVTTAAAGPGHWNDPDMLVIGGFGLTPNQATIQMALWCLMASPLLMGNDLRHLAPHDRQVLSNRELIAINQDPLGLQGRRVRGNTTSTEVWTRALINGEVALAIIHRTNHEPYFPYNFDVPLTSLALLHDWDGPIEVRDVVRQHDMAVVDATAVLSVPMQPFSVVMYRLRRQGRLLPSIVSQSRLSLRESSPSLDDNHHDHDRLEESLSSVPPSFHPTLRWCPLVGVATLLGVYVMKQHHRIRYQTM